MPEAISRTNSVEQRAERRSKWTRPIIFRLRGTVILHIWFHLVLLILYTTVIVCLHNFVDGMKMTYPFTLVPVLGVVTGLLLVFRTNTAYARYWEGRCLWSKMTVQIRHLTRLIWVSVEEEGEDEAANVKLVIEKTSAINLLVAFAVATKNYLREEYSYEEADMKGFIGHLPRFRHSPSPPPPSSSLSKNHRPVPCGEDHPIRTGSLGPPRVSGSGKMDNGGVTSINTNILFPEDNNCDEKLSQRMRKASCTSGTNKSVNVFAHDTHCPTHIPIEISFYIYSYVNNVVAKGLADGSATYFMYDSLMTLVDCMTGFERILRTPIPLAYGVHLHQAVYLFLLALPYQLVGNLNWWCIPAVGMASFAFLGIMRIGLEIENPFGYDHNDLPLDDFCKVIQQETQVILGNPIPKLETWTLSNKNYPLAPRSWLSAEELSQRPLSELRTVLAKGSEFQGEPPVASKWKNLVYQF